MSPDALRLAVVGCGRMGTQHARSAARLGHRVAVACDPDPARAAALAAAHDGCRALADPAALPWEEVDAAFVCTPPFARGPVELAAARAGVPLFLEKPIGLSAEALRPALEAARAGGVLTSVGYMNRYRGSVRRAREVLAGEAVLGFAAHWMGAPYRVPWWGDPARSGGQLNEQCTHVLDLARHLAGEVAEVHAIAQPSADPAAATAAVSVLLRFRSGALGTVLCGCLASEKQIGCRVFTARGQVALEGWDFRWSPGTFGDAGGLDAAEDPFLEECAAFLDAVRSGDGGRIRCDLAEAMRTQRVVDAARAALDGGGRRRVEAREPAVEGSLAIDPV
jgi:predicted dehydrogenase